MNADRLLAHYEKIDDAPDAISRLRRFILDLAVRGKLVEQDPNDEPATELLRRIEAERKERIARGEIRRAKPLNSITHAPFDPPSDWTWLPLGETGNIFIGNSINAATREQLEKTEEGLPFIATKDVGYGFDEIDYANGLLVELSHERFKIVRSDSVLICAEGGSAGRKIALTDREISFGNKLLANETWSVISPKFVLCVYVSDFFYAQFAEKMTGVIGGISLRNFLQLPFPLPPLAEQRRIVAKVDELMALCDRLETARTERETTRDRLTTASLTRLDTLDPDPAVFQNHAAFALDSLSPLTTRPDQVKALRQTILNLAVRGKLVEQNPNDEPAWKLLARIRTAKTEQKRKTGDARIKTAPEANCGSLPFELPNDWSAQSFENLFLFIDYRGKTPPKRDNGIALITAKNVRMGHLDREPREYVSDATFRTWMTRGFPRIGDLFFTTEAPLGNVCLNDIDEPFALAQRVICMQPYADINTRFLMYGLMSDSIQSLINAHATGLTAKGIKAAKLKPLPILIPPLAEQHRIVAKVDELMTLCDRLEANLATGDYTRCRLLDALLHEALAPSEEKSGSIIPTIAQKAPDKPPGSPKMLTEPKPAGTSPA